MTLTRNDTIEDLDLTQKKNCSIVIRVVFRHFLSNFEGAIL